MDSVGGSTALAARASDSSSHLSNNSTAAPIVNKERPEVNEEDATPRLLATIQSLVKQVEDLKAALLRSNEELTLQQERAQDIVTLTRTNEREVERGEAAKCKKGSEMKITLKQIQQQVESLWHIAGVVHTRFTSFLLVPAFCSLDRTVGRGLLCE